MENPSVAETSFSALGLSPKVLEAIAAAGYTSPTPIQAAAIPVAVTGRDVLGIAQTGTGKTASFVLPMITRLETGRARARMPRSLILAPTRELAAQCAQSFEKYGANHKLSLALLIGGVSMDDQVKKLDRGVDVLIATPGRLLDHFQRGRLMLMGVEILVIDEADRMLDMGFIPDIEKICKLLPPRRQTLFFSATMPPEITRLVDQFLKDPMRVEVARPATTAKTITQRFRFCTEGEDWAKREILRDLMREDDVRNAIIFCNRKRDVAILLKSLLKHGFNAGALHGDMDQKSRMETLDKFRSGDIKFLAASDVAARGLDIPDVSHVFNFDLPWQSDDYVHRIGRTGRAGKEGNSTSLVTRDDLKILKDIEKIAGGELGWIGEPPSSEDFAESGKRRGRGGRGARGRQGGEQRHSQRDDRHASRPSRSSERGEPRRDRQQPRSDSNAVMEARNEPQQEQRRDRRPAEGQGDRVARPGAEQPRIHDERPVERSVERPVVERPVERQVARPPQGNRPAATGQAQRQPRASAPQPGPDRGPRERPTRGVADRGASGGFADNVPAFLRRPPRPAKVASE